MERPKVLVADEIHPEGIALLRQSADILVNRSDISSADAIIVRTFRVGSEVIRQAKNLKVIGKHGAGVDNIDIPAATDAKIPVLNTPGGANALAVAEGAVALILAAVRYLRTAHDMVTAGLYAERSSLLAGHLTEKTLGLVGLGNIGSLVAGILRRGFSMHVIVFDPYLNAEQAKDAGVSLVGSLKELLSAADVVSLHVPLTPETRGMIGERELALMKPDAVIVNTARGGLIDEEALASALKNGRLRGAGVDVFEQEPPRPDNPLFSAPNILLSPHSAGITTYSMRQMADQTVKLVLGCLAGRRPETLLNPEVWKFRRMMR
ncbi:hydroxyacid dehydrogenase [Ferrovibrio sp.]|uniref:hydroxyacid dehydrogenase n=1 Tax=Ferrovibrio sp. TaxID=1917215 RepID=UPI000CC57686|nr:hydroxyacid dehydrogenase [Ferrovibrio sp.]PJI40335.1 MAG: D-3-phosphoglycerate dehydrogenase [Ferrovibrio sp.]